MKRRTGPMMRGTVNEGSALASIGKHGWVKHVYDVCMFAPEVRPRRSLLTRWHYVTGCGSVSVLNGFKLVQNRSGGRERIFHCFFYINTTVARRSLSNHLCYISPPRSAHITSGDFCSYVPQDHLCKCVQQMVVTRCNFCL